GMHPVLLLLDGVPVLLVERRALFGAGGAVAGVSLAGRQPRREDRRPARRARGPVPPLSLPHDHELHPHLPEKPEPGQGDRRNQEDAGAAALAFAASQPLSPGLRPGGAAGQPGVSRIPTFTENAPWPDLIRPPRPFSASKRRGRPRQARPRGAFGDQRFTADTRIKSGHDDIGMPRSPVSAGRERRAAADTIAKSA